MTHEEILAANPTLALYLVSYREEPGDKFVLHFECYAEDADHASDQAQNAYPDAEIVNVTKGPI